MIAPPLVVWLSLTWGWQVAFMVTGLMAVGVAVLWGLLYRDPEKHHRLSDEERAYIVGDEPTTALPKPSMKDVLAKKKFWGIAAARFLTEPAWQTFSYWIPLYMVTARAWTSSSSRSSLGCRSWRRTQAAFSAGTVAVLCQSLQHVAHQLAHCRHRDRGGVHDRPGPDRVSQQSDRGHPPVLARRLRPPDVSAGSMPS